MQTDINSTFVFLQTPPLLNVTEASTKTVVQQTITSTNAVMTTLLTARYPLSGVTVAGYSNGTAGTGNNALANPYGLALGIDGSLFVADFSNARVMKLQNSSLIGIRVAGTGAQGNGSAQLHSPGELVIDASSNIYINDDYNHRVVLWYKNASIGIIVAGNGTLGNTTNTLGNGIGLARDSNGNLYVSDQTNNRIMKWAPNATSGTLFAGTGVAGNTSWQLNYPYGLYLDQNNSYLYVTDSGNNRILRYPLNNGTIGTIVAGGHGSGSSSDQLNNPYDICVSKTGDIYIADKANHRIQLWSAGATTGVTITGITGLMSTNATMLHGPSNVIFSSNETFLYVSDNGNNRVQRYQLT